jgi:glutamate racemase
VKKLLPREQLLYFGDTANAPYGERSTEAILELTRKAAEPLIARSKALVLACNTATAVAADALRASYPDFPIIGMEPALLPAVRDAAEKVPRPFVAVLATAATLREKKFAKLRKRCEKNATVWPISAPDIVRMVEKGTADSLEMDGYLRSLASRLPSRPDAIVLGCTHFPFAANAIRRVFEGIPLYDGAKGTAKEVCRRLAEQSLLSPASTAGGVTLFSSAPTALPLLAKLYSL